ncbi:hypothetical protein G6F68_014875 [Rhizopus microsporus]|nr:hypothetical protein G6F68_014875 [Rhizopus microsporus]
MPQMIGAVGTPTAVPSPATRLPSDSISNCCRYVTRCSKRALASWIGAFEANGACWKCSSIASAPARMPISTSAPTVNAIDRPATDHTE